MTREKGGVKDPEAVLGGLLKWVRQTHDNRAGVGSPLLPLGHYANVICLTKEALAITTDGVGTKVLVAELLGRYDTIGIDCVAMNANDILCVGAEPLAMVDYVAVQQARREVLEEIGKGLHEGARRARITIPGGELAQLGGMLAGTGRGKGLDLVGTAVGIVDKVIYGADIAPGDIIMGLGSSGIHSNGLTLARHVFFNEQGWRVGRSIPEFGRSLGEELLEPTRIYVPEVIEMLEEGVKVHGLAHITSGGLLNLLRLKPTVNYDITYLPEAPPVFQLIQELGGIPDSDMHRTFNMGVGFCIVLPPAELQAAMRIVRKHCVPCWELGVVSEGRKGAVKLWPRDLISENNYFRRLDP